MIQISDHTIQVLQRMAELQARFSTGVWSELEEYQRLVDATTNEIWPVVEMLVAAGLLMIAIETGPDSDPRTWAKVEYEVGEAVRNGQITLWAGAPMAFTPVKRGGLNPSDFSYDVKAYFMDAGDWKGWRDFLGAPTDSLICDECGYHPCKCHSNGLAPGLPGLPG